MPSFPRAAPIDRETVLAEIGPLPLPGSGRTAERWDALARLGRRDLPLVKLVEPHHDAAAILLELGQEPPRAGEVWAVWAAEPPFAVLSGSRTPDGWRLSGSKAFCSGALLATHALVTAQTEDGSRLFALEVGDPGIRLKPAAQEWVGVGMSRAATHTVELDHVPAEPVGAAGAYVDRPGFWFGAVGIAACWLGGARGVADTLENAASRLDPHGRAHLGAVRADLDTLGLAFEAAARHVDDGTWHDHGPERLAHAIRARAAAAVEDVISHVGRALGPGPLAFDAAHADRVADLQVFVRQHHAERDLDRLGSIGSDHG